MRARVVQSEPEKGSPRVDIPDRRPLSVSVRRTPPSGESAGAALGGQGRAAASRRRREREEGQKVLGRLDVGQRLEEAAKVPVRF